MRTTTDGTPQVPGRIKYEHAYKHRYQLAVEEGVQRAVPECVCARLLHEEKRSRVWRRPRIEASRRFRGGALEPRGRRREAGRLPRSMVRYVCAVSFEIPEVSHVLHPDEHGALWAEVCVSRDGQERLLW